MKPEIVIKHKCTNTQKIQLECFWYFISFFSCSITCEIQNCFFIHVCNSDKYSMMFMLVIQVHCAVLEIVGFVYICWFLISFLNWLPSGKLANLQSMKIQWSLSKLNLLWPTFVFAIDRCSIYTGYIYNDFLHWHYI